MRVLLADGDPDVRGALRLLLIQDLGMQVTGEAADAIELRGRTQAARPDLLLLDWTLAGARASDVMAGLRALSPGLRIVVLSAHPETRPHALAAGADAFVSKADAPAQLVTTLRALHAPGATACSGDGAARVADDGAGAGNAPEWGDT